MKGKSRKRKNRKHHNPMKDVVRNSLHYTVGKKGTLDENVLQIVCVNFKKSKYWEKK